MLLDSFTSYTVTLKKLSYSTLKRSYDDLQYIRKQIKLFMSTRKKIIERIVNINPYYTKEELQEFTKKELEETLENSLLDFYGYSVYSAAIQ